MFLTKSIKRPAEKSTFLSERLPVFALEENKVIFRDGRVGVGFRVQGAPLESWTEGYFRQAHQVLTRQLKLLPVGTVVHKTDVYYDRAFYPDESDKPYYESKLLAHFTARLVLTHESYLFLSFPSKSTYRYGKVNPITSGFSQAHGMPFGSSVKNPYARIEKLLQEAETIAREFMEGFYSFRDVSFTRLDDEALNQLLVRYLNLSFEEKGETLNRQVYHDPSGIVVGEKKANIISMQGQGSEVFTSIPNDRGISSPYTYALSQALPFPHIVTQCILIEDTERALKSLDLERKLNDSLEWLTTQEHQLKAEELDEFTALVRSENARLVSLHQSVLVYSSDDELRQSYVDKTVAALRSLYGAEALIESYDTANLFFASLPGNGFQHYRWLMTADQMAACYLHFMSDVMGDQQGDYLCDRFRNLLQVNLFNTHQSNQNCVVIGPSGSGKSYTMGNFIAQRLERGARQIIIDKGGTYRNVMYALSGQDFENTYFEYSAEKPLAFNPFLLEKDAEGHYQLTSEKSNFLIALLSTLWKGSSYKGNDRADSSLTPAERAIFQLMLPRYYDHLNERKNQQYPGMHSFYHFLRRYHAENRENLEYQTEMHYFDIEQLLLTLKPFVSGKYKEVLNAVKELDISAHALVCFDLDKINSDPVLYPVVTLLITELALDQIRQYPDQIKYLYLDEAWAMLSGSLQEFIEDLFRTIRKNNGSVSIITQGLSEIRQSSVGEAILVNAATKIILKHEDDRLVEELARHLGFTAHEVDLIKSIRVEKDFRELFIKQGEEARVYLLETSPHLDAVLSSKPSERNYLRKLIAYYHGNLPHAVNQFVETKRSNGEGLTVNGAERKNTTEAASTNGP
ncbi:MAG: type IV secretion system DNA-binding domain-containing protein [Cyclobacteriaceae bacterium]